MKIETFEDINTATDICNQCGELTDIAIKFVDGSICRKCLEIALKEIYSDDERSGEK